MRITFARAGSCILRGLGVGNFAGIVEVSAAVDADAGEDEDGACPLLRQYRQGVYLMMLDSFATMV